MPKRTRTIQWEDPQISSRDTQSISGLDYLCAIRDGNMAPPPAAKLVGYHIVDVDAGQAVFDHPNVKSPKKGDSIITVIFLAFIFPMHPRQNWFLPQSRQPFFSDFRIALYTLLRVV